MARITVEDCLKNVDNQFDLVMVAAKRARRIANGAEPLVDLEDDKPTVVALREIAAGLINEKILSEMDEPVEDILSSEEAEELLASTPMPGAGSDAAERPRAAGAPAAKAAEDFDAELLAAVQAAIGDSAADEEDKKADDLDAELLAAMSAAISEDEGEGDDAGDEDANAAPATDEDSDDEDDQPSY